MMYNKSGDKMKKIAVINDLSGLGKCSLAAALPIIAAHGVQCCPMATGVYSNQTAYESYRYTDLTDSLLPFCEEWLKRGVIFDAIVTGFIANAKQGDALAQVIDKLKNEKTLVVVDPVMADDGARYDGFDDERVEAVKRLTRKADIIMPNLTELCLLTDTDYRTLPLDNANALLDAVKALTSRFSCDVVVTGLSLDDTVANAVYQQGRWEVIQTPKIQNGVFSGTGDIMTAYVTAACVNGADLCTAVKNAADFITRAMKLTVENKNHRPEDGIDFEALIKTFND